MRHVDARGAELVRAGWGTALLVAPRQVMTRVHHVQVDRPSTAVARVLGARHLVQAGLSGLSPSAEVLALGVWVDTAHALTAVGLAAVDRTRARAGLTDAAIAAAWAGLGLVDLRRGRGMRSSHGRRRDRLARAVLRRVPGGTWLRRAARG